MILIGLGGNLPGGQGQGPVATLEAALGILEERGLKIIKKSPWYKSEPVPKSDQPWFVNGVVVIESDLGPHGLLDTLLAVEQELGRTRGAKNEARTVDLDLLDHRGDIIKDDGLVLPHPRMRERLFVLRPLSDIAPHWKHPETGENVQDLIAGVGGAQRVEPL